jgi:nitroimidazol reductase NimA-like FMN-containing flavoprotein (pyridoxamine 5'-phosphate oxidase superfamily)
MKRNKNIADKLKKLLEESYFGVLATQMGDKPYTNLIATMPRNDFQSIIFATPKATRKYTNLKKNPEASIMFDNRSNAESDISNAIAANASGTAKEIDALEEREEIISAFKSRNPAISDFLESPTTVIFELKVKLYYCVEHFQQVAEIHMGDSQ